MAIRRRALVDVGGFDERFMRAYREDSDLGLRLAACGHRILLGDREVLHPVGPAPWHVSITKQAGNRDDALMGRLHGPDWRVRAGAPRGRLRAHVLTTLAAATAIASFAAGHRRTARAAALAWSAGWLDFTLRRTAPGPRSASEIASMAITSAVVPVVAPVWWLRGRWSARHESVKPRQPPIDLVLFDRDGTLVVDVPYNGDPAAVRPMPGARDALDRLRRSGVAVGVVTNQSAIGRGLLTERDVAAVNARVESILGPLDVWAVCPHAAADGCTCRKPAPGLVQRAARAMRVDPARCVVIGDIGSDVGAAAAAGARSILVPTAVKHAEEIESAPVVARDLAEAVDLVFGCSTSARMR
jgi:HAD superfamily hydrolase (TIGR01662 family)